MAARKGYSRPSVSTREFTKLKDEVHSYHIDVSNVLAKMQENCVHCKTQIDGLDLQINGEKPERDDAPSMRHDITSLKQSRNSLRRGVQIAWAVLLGLGGIVGSMFTFKGKW